MKIKQKIINNKIYIIKKINIKYLMNISIKIYKKKNISKIKFKIKINIILFNMDIK